MQNKEYYVQKDAKTEPPGNGQYFVILNDGYSRWGCWVERRFGKWMLDFDKEQEVTVLSYLTPCTDPLFTMEEVQQEVLSELEGLLSLGCHPEYIKESIRSRIDEIKNPGQLP